MTSMTVLDNNSLLLFVGYNNKIFNDSLSI